MNQFLLFRRTGIAISQVQRNYFAPAASGLILYCATVSRKAGRVLRFSAGFSLI